MNKTLSPQDQSYYCSKYIASCSESYMEVEKESWLLKLIYYYRTRPNEREMGTKMNQDSLGLILGLCIHQPNLFLKYRKPKLDIIVRVPSIEFNQI